VNGLNSTTSPDGRAGVELGAEGAVCAANGSESKVVATRLRRWRCMGVFIGHFSRE